MIFIIATTLVSAQREYDTWYFGQRAGVRFTPTGPVGVRGPIDTDEGTGIWCNPLSGTPVISTDGDRVYDSTGSLLINGTGLRGGYSSTNSALVVPDPGAIGRYYIFCAGDLSNSTKLDSSFTVSIADMNNSGLGTIIKKNDTLLLGTAEKVAGTKHCDGESWWVVTHDTSLPRFYVFKVTRAGIVGPDIYDVGEQYYALPTVLGNEYGMGSLKFSASGGFLAMASPLGHMVELFDFDVSSGVISNPRRVDSADLYYGLSFSPNERFLYVVCWNPSVNQQSPIFQFDIQNSFSKYRVGSLSATKDLDNGGIQRGPDDKIYIVNNTSLRVIDNPDLVGPACSYGRQVPLYPGTAGKIGLPTIMDCLFKDGGIEICSPPVTIFSGADVACIGTCITYTDASKKNPTLWKWEFEGGKPSTYLGKTPPPICYESAGTFRVVLITQNRFGADTTTSQIQVIVTKVSAGDDILLCDSASGQLHATGALRYEWMPTDGLDNPNTAEPIVTIFTTTQYIVRGWDVAGCDAYDTVIVFVQEKPYPTDQFEINSINGLAGDNAQLVITKTQAEFVTNATFTISIPRAIFFLDDVERGTLISNTITDLQTQSVVIVGDLSNDTVVIIKGLLLLKDVPQEVTSETNTTDSCFQVATTPGIITSQACSAGKRAIITGQNPLTIVTIAQGGREIFISGQPRSSYQLSVWSTSGENLATHSGTFHTTEEIINLDQHFPQIIFVRLSSGDLSTLQAFISN